MKKIIFTIFAILSISVVYSKTLVLECSDLVSEFSQKTEVIIDTNAEFISMPGSGSIVKDYFYYDKEGGEIKAWGVINEYGKDADFRHIKYLEKEKILAWSDSFYRPRGVWAENPPHEHVSWGDFDILKCK